MAADQHILDSTSFSSLDVDGQSAVRALYNNYRSKESFIWDETIDIFRRRKSLQALLSTAKPRLGEINPASFKFLNEQQKQALINELLFTFYCLSAQYHLDEAEHRRQGLKELCELINTCALYAHILENMSAERSPQALLDEAIEDSTKSAKYLGLVIVAPLITQTILDMSSGKTTEKPSDETQTEKPSDKIGSEMSSSKTGTTIDSMSKVNVRRLYWVWGGGLLASVLELLPDDFAHKQQAQKAVSAPAPYTGYMSWILYYTRFGISLGLLLKHTIAGPWMSEAEQEIPAWERFKTQWEQRRFSMINDSVWGFANMSCFYWLRGAGTLGYLGNVVTAGLLLMDVSINVWNFYYQSTIHNATMLNYERSIDSLNHQISSTSIDAAEKKVLEIELARLIKNIAKAECDWKYKKYGIINDLTYSVGLLIAFSVVCCFFFPPAAIAPATAMVLGVAGAALCFLLTVAYPAVSGVLEIDKTKAIGKTAHEEYIELLRKFKHGDNDDFTKKQLYLDIKRLKATSEYQEKLVDHQKMQLVRAVLVDALIPPLIFTSFVFLPAGIGLMVLAAGLALALLTYKMLEDHKPAETKLPEFDDVAYMTFLTNPPREPVSYDPSFLARPSGYQPVATDETPDQSNGDGIEMPPA